MGLVTDESSTAEPVISALSDRPLYPLNIDRSMKDWLTDPSYSMEAFRQAGGKDPIVELMRENVEIPGRFGFPAGLSGYMEYLGYLRALTAKEREIARTLWDDNRIEGNPPFCEIETFMLSSASIFRKLSVLSSANIIMGRIYNDRQERETRAALELEQKKHDEAILQPQKESATRAQRSQGSLQSKLDKLQSKYNVLKDDNKRLNGENIQLIQENNNLRAIIQESSPPDADSPIADHVRK